MKKKYLTLLILLINALYLISCRPLGEFISPTYVNNPFPESDIVFQLGAYSEGGTDKIGFVNANGDQLEYFYLSERDNIKQPTWTDDGGAIFFGTPGYVVPALVEKDYPVSIVLRNVSAYQPSIIHNTHELLLNSGGILRIDYTTGEILDTYAIYREGDVISIGTNNFIEQNLLFQRLFGDDEYQHTELVILDTNTHQENIILSYSGTPQEITHIINPAFSPDGEWIAYTSNDGIYLIRSDRSENQLIVALGNTAEQFWKPTVSWSPDGKSIVYHNCIVKNWWECQGDDKLENNIIYRYNLDTEEETVLVVGGVNPYWRWKETK